jgi:hypothetical protein
MSDVQNLLRSVHRAGGYLAWSETDPAPFGLDRAVEYGYAVRQDGSAWAAHEGCRITRKGLRAIGVEPPPTLWDRIVARW